MAVTPRGKPARTAYRVVERRGTSSASPTTLLELALQSGRTHQIRVHMAAIGHPVVGDARYGTPDKRLGSGRFFLHASRLAFDHPGTGSALGVRRRRCPTTCSAISRSPELSAGLVGSDDGSFEA